jgi:hypothetical protein
MDAVAPNPFETLETGITKSGDKLYVVTRIDSSYDETSTQALYATTDRLLAERMAVMWSRRIDDAVDKARAMQKSNSAVRDLLHKNRPEFPSEEAFKAVLTAFHQATYHLEHTPLQGVTYIVDEVEMVTTVSDV